MYEIEAEARDLVSHGVNACAGRSLELILRNIVRTLGGDTAAIAPPGCTALSSGIDNAANVKIASYQCGLEDTVASVAGVRAGPDAQGNRHTTALTSAGDGATADIGLQSLSGAMKRGDRVLYVYYDNEAYINTGIQGSSATPYGVDTATTPAGRPTYKKDLLKIAIVHHIPYAVSCSVTNLLDLVKKVRKVKGVNGPSLLRVRTPYPTGWVFPPTKSTEVYRVAIETETWILYEYKEGWITVNKRVKGLRLIGDYLPLQGRLKNMTEIDMEALQRETVARYEELSAPEG